MKIIDHLHGFFWQSPTTNNCNTYLITGGKNILIDPGHQDLFGHVTNALAGLSLALEDLDLVVITHGHPDHMEALKAFRDSGALAAVGAAEMAFIRQMAPHYGAALGMPDFEPDLLLQEGELHVDGVTLQVIHTPGHSPGSLCLYWAGMKALFTGDVVFQQGVGRTDLPGGSGEALKESIRRISRLDVEYLLPGHGEMVSGRAGVRANFKEVERAWFAYL
jgi:glyoxylase-like metal-dependent hydrolase (beta-lactamase superfamily II)